MTNRVQIETSLKRGLNQKVAEVEYHVMPRSAVCFCARYRPVKFLVYLQMVPGCKSGGDVFYVPSGLIRSWYAFGICQLLRSMAVDLVLALVAIGQLTEINWHASEAHV